MRLSMELIIIALSLLFLLPIFRCSYATDTIGVTRAIMDGETIVSSGGSFELGFFSPGDSKNRYVGIWFKKISIQTAVWVANRETPLHNTSGVLNVSSTGVLILLNSTNDIIWSSNTSTPVQNPVAQLLDSGNLVVRDADDDNPENFVWQSFYCPGNTLLPGMKLGINFITGRSWYFSSWKSDNDPAPGNYTYGMDNHGYPELIMWQGSVEKFRYGPWNGIRFSGSPSLKPSPMYRYNYVYNESEVYYSYELVNSSVVSRRVLNPNGVVQRWTWLDEKHDWAIFSNGPLFDNCDAYALCGAYGSCDLNNALICGCLNKFVPKDQINWDMGDWSKGCIRRKPLSCENGDGFLKYSGIKLPETRNSWFSVNMTLKDCSRMCLANCSCMAYSNLNISGKGSGCLLWFGSLIDIKVLGDDGQDIFVRMASSEIDEEHQVGRKIIVIVASTIGVLFLCLILALLLQKKRRLLNSRAATGHIFEHNMADKNQEEDLQLRLFDLAAITNATDNFSINNRLGEGGFGPVYKGLLEGGQEIAVKRLSSRSTQGLKEFKNEVICIAKLQHWNLVKLLGYCVKRGEKMLIYEYMPNKSLDLFIFDETRSTLLIWPKRFNIINGISRGILYLHQDSRLRIIHRDLKASNVLLDIDMNPKIADFGLARSFGRNETEAQTCRVVGTFGYMSPEYQVDGIFSVRSDVFSFGVLVLEIVSGKKNRGFYHPDHCHNLLGHAWMLYNEGRSLELIDATAIDDNSCYLSEMLRSIHVALLCVQRYPEDRPSMSSVVLMLSSDVELPHPKQPGFFTERKPVEVESSASRDACSPNGVTITLLDGR